MEEKGSSSSSSSSTSRWNPTKDQIALLEALYKQGIRTPSSEQIQQITLKLREFGMTEGKNVFYWFQNHKARQRQKIKQERFAYYSRLLNNGMPMAPPVMAPPPPPPHGLNKNVMTGPYCLPAPQVGGVHGCYPPSYQNMLLPRPMQVSPTLPQAHQFPRVEPYHATSYGLNHNGANVINASAHSFSLETLQLFPLHPTGILEAERSPSSLTSPSIEHPERVVVDDHGDGDSDGGDDEEEEVGEINNPPFFNFLG